MEKKKNYYIELLLGEPARGIKFFATGYNLENVYSDLSENCIAQVDGRRFLFDEPGTPVGYSELTNPDIFHVEGELFYAATSCLRVQADKLSESRLFDILEDFSAILPDNYSINIESSFGRPYFSLKLHQFGNSIISDDIEDSLFLFAKRFRDLQYYVKAGIKPEI